MEIERWDNGEVIFSGESIQEGIAKGIVFYHADLRSADLSGANLSGADLGSADLSGADLSGANLGSADLSGANLRSANLRSADLSGADLSGANLDMAGIPLSCGGLRWKIDRRIFVQFVYHLCSHQIENDDCKAVQKSLIKLANEMHRTDVPRLEE